MRATDLNKMQKARITHIDMMEQDAMRLFYLGIYEGAWIQMIQKAPLQDPYIFYVRGSFILLRKKDACKLEVELV
ncbi:FeoA family protein [[Eubacterium] hominis]|uniref:FeoA family protein n=1 Tax=[Eubacterium] hominis TaxID=2764325 RepID=UPI003A4E38A4